MSGNSDGMSEAGTTPQGKANELSDADLDALIDAMDQMKKPDGHDEKTFEEKLEVSVFN